MNFSVSTVRPWLLVAGLALSALGTAHADDHRRMSPSQILPAYTQECASCHTAYPPGMLPAGSWKRIMTGLDRHYGTDASLDDATVKQIGAWLQANAGTGRRVSEAPPEDRITRSAWFQHKHDEIAPSVWKLASVKSAANCSACHVGADRGDYDEDNIRMPAGASRSRHFWND